MGCGGESRGFLKRRKTLLNCCLFIMEPTPHVINKSKQKTKRKNTSHVRKKKKKGGGKRKHHHLRHIQKIMVSKSRKLDGFIK